jgi:ATP-dependent Clp protease ATP-binding subunit ClpC
MKEHVRLHRLYTSVLFRVVRLLVLCVLLVLVLTGFFQGQVPKLALFCLSWALMIEVFFHFALSRIAPRVVAVENDGKQPLASFTHAALDAFLSSSRPEGILRELLRLPEVQFLLERMLITEKDVPTASVNLPDWMQQAVATVKARRGTYVTAMDCFAAYLFMTEAATKLLFQKELHPEDLDAILEWGILTFPEAERVSIPSVSWIGSGIADGLMTGWTPETKQYTIDFTAQALASPRSLIGREQEYAALISALAKPEANNVLIIGAPGVGKEKLVETLAIDSFSGSLAGPVNHKRIITLMIGTLLAGAGDRSELESRLQAIIAELTHAGNIILSIPELQEIMGDSSYNLNLSGALLPYLKTGALPIIATMTPGNYKTYMEKNGLREVFTTISLTEPELPLARRMLYRKIPEFERLFRVLIPYVTLKQVLAHAHTYLPDDVLPGSGVRLLSDAAQNERGETLYGRRRVVLPQTVIAQVEVKAHANVGPPQQAEKTLLLHLEQKLHERIIGQEQAITVIAEALRRLRSGITKADKPISFLFLGPTGVGKTETAKALADLYYGGEAKMLRLDMSEYVDAAGVERLLGAPPGAGDERGELTDKIHDHPYTLVLLDEFEKAHPKILDLFLQVLADGRLTDNKGRTVSFTNAIIIATSNAGSEFVREAVTQGSEIGPKFQEKLLEQLQTEHLFKPELLNRFDAVVTYRPLTQAEGHAVAELLLKEITKQLAEQDITVKFDDQVLAKIAEEGSDEQFGARPLKRYIQDTIEDMIAKLKLEEKLKRGNTVHFSLDAAGKIIPTIA